MRTLIAVVALAVAAQPVCAQTGAFVVRLGRDTTAVEQYTRTGSQIVGDGVYRQPRTTVRHFTIDFGSDGRATHEEFITRQANAPAGATPAATVTATFRRDTFVVEIKRDTGAVQTRRIAAPPDFVPIIGPAASSWVGLELMSMRLRAARADSISLPIYSIGAAQTSTWSAKNIGRDSVWLYDGNNVFRAKVERDGRIIGAFAVSGTQQFTVERVSRVDINGLATSFAARDQAGQSLGLLSPRDTVRVAAAGANLWIDYSKPAKRGRVIFGSTIVPYGEVWRTGANAATQFRTDKALEIGGITLPAGFYTLWTIPSPTGWKLLINSQTGQWGTAHDATKDIYQVDMTTSTLPQPVERFTITVVPGGQGGTINMDWDTIRASIPFTVRQ